MESTLPSSFQPLPTLMVVPSGIGCSLGGYAGDAIPAARLLAAASGSLITHPNVMNGASLYWSDNRIQYVEGYSLDLFAAGKIALGPVRQQKIGLLLDVGIEPELKHRNLQVVDGCRASLGLNIIACVSTQAPLDIRLNLGPSGASWGQIGQPEALLVAGEKLQQLGATAIAVVSRFPDESVNELTTSYRHGNGIDCLAGAEAVISHLLVKHLGIPCAHAPALSSLPIDFGLDPRVAGEELGHSFLSCVLVGLSRAPDLLPIDDTEQLHLRSQCGVIYSEQIGAVVAPNGAIGGGAVLASLERGLPLILVNNPGVLNISLSDLFSKEDFVSANYANVMYAENYLEAAGMLMLLREGISLESLQRPISRLSEV